VVSIQAVERKDEAVEEAGLPRRRGLVMALGGELVLLAPADAPLLRHLLAVLAHREPGPRLGDPGRRGLEILQGKARPGLEALGEAAPARAPQHDLLQLAAVGERDVARAVGAARDRALDLAERNAVRELQRSREARAAGALQVVGGRLRIEAAAERALACEVPVARVLDDRARRHLADPLALQRIFVHQEAKGRGQHVLVAELRIGAVGARERNTRAAEDRDATGELRHGAILGVSWAGLLGSL